MFYKELLKRMNPLMEQAFNIGAEITIWCDERDFGKDPVKLYLTTVKTYEHLTKWLKDMRDLKSDKVRYEVQNYNNQEHSDYKKTYQILSYVLYPLKTNFAEARKKIELFMLEHQID